MFVEKKTLAIACLSLSACLLAFLDFLPAPAKADLVLKDRDYQVITGKGSNTGDDLYVLDGRTGLMAVFVYDQTRHGVFPRTFVSVANLFGPQR